LDRVDWVILSGNPNAIDIFKNNLDNIHWQSITENPNVIHILAKIDYEKMRENCEPLLEELCKKVFNPTRTIRMAETYNCTDAIEYLEAI
jgi:hypothetical protein